MAFILPVFPLTVNVWRSGNPTVNPPDVVTVGNLAYGKRVTTQYWNWNDPDLLKASVFSVLLLPPLADVRDLFSAGGPDTLEAPAGSGRFYLVDMVDDLGKGFANEHRFAICEKIGTWPSPIP